MNLCYELQLLGHTIFTQLAILPTTYYWSTYSLFTKGETDTIPKEGMSKLDGVLRTIRCSSACTSDNAPQHKATSKDVLSTSPD